MNSIDLSQCGGIVEIREREREREREEEEEEEGRLMINFEKCTMRKKMLD
jgi:hypothetical protein